MGRERQQVSQTIWVQVVPRAARSEVRGEIAGHLRVAVAAPPVDDAANQELIRFLANLLGISRRQIAILSGHHTRRKRLSLEGVTEERLRQIFPPPGSPS
jgi:uncharacterized protein (TIGR00251 family)